MLSLTTPSSLPSPLPLEKLKSELAMLVGQCPEEPLEGDMSSPNSTGTQVRQGTLWDLSKTKLATQDPKSVSLALGSPDGDAGWAGGPGGET